MRIKSRQKGHAKFLSEWSEPHEVLNVRGVVVTVRELSSGREYRTHHDRLSNPLFSGRKGVEVHRHEQNANPIENPAEPEDESELAGVPEEPLTQTRSGRTIRPRRDPNYDYEFMFSELKSTCTSARSNTCFNTSASTRTSTKVCTSSVRTSVNYSSLSTLACSMSYVYSRSLLCLTNATATLALRPRANLESLPLLQESMIRDQRQQMRNLGERTSWMQEADGTQKLVMMLKRNGTLFQLDTDRGEWVTLLDQATLKEVLDEEQWAEPTGQRTLLDEEVALPPFFKDLPGFDSGAHKWPRYGLQKPWRDLVAARMERRKITLPPLFGLAANPDVAAAAANLGGTAAAVPVFAVPMMSVSEMLSPTNVKTVSTTWATAPRMTTTAQAVNLDESTSIAQLSQVESVRLASASSASEASASRQPQVPVAASTFIAQTATPARTLTTVVLSQTSTTQTQARPPSLPQSEPQPAIVSGPSLSTGQFTGESSMSPIFQSMSESAPGSVKPGAQTSTEEEPMDFDVRPEVPSEDECESMLDRSLRDVLEQFTQHPGGDIALLNLRPLIAIFERLGYVLEERLPPIENLEARDLSVFGYLQIAERLPSTNIVALNLDEFNQLVTDVVKRQYSVYSRSFHPQNIEFKTLMEMARILVRDPVGVLRGEPETKPKETATSSRAATQLLPVAQSYLQGFHSALLAAAQQSFPAPPKSTSQLGLTLSSPPIGRTSTAEPQRKPRQPTQTSTASAIVETSLTQVSQRVSETEEELLGSVEGGFNEPSGFSPSNLGEVLQHLPPIQTPKVTAATLAPRKAHTGAEDGRKESAARSQ